MKKFLFCAAVALFLAGCGEGPEKAMEKAFLAVKKCNIDEAYKYMHFENKTEGEAWLNKTKQSCKNNEKYREIFSQNELLTAPKIIEKNDKKAIVEFTWRCGEAPEKTTQETFVKVGGKWLLSK